ncbi:hypothetical protein CEUSTIGMA_g12586.t1 [Chlamydomonas eustigma]|uniref:Thioredoxin domain-containing protein n=1 Tax=Chlamydomonas eustigma TaxID=1157962 RepID=A0A250XQ31_9CHLO|nr:hypothetical protein CEUSTIGMA_g12586.t1 [Chlamydomonas eustigma]|eukprot:GAX85168.1 hypothetical protein CEUSTIGMA_g12586.t1 [Chlamydomonas eustigma]
MALPLPNTRNVLPPSDLEYASVLGVPLPPRKTQSHQIGPQMHGIRTDEEYDTFVDSNKGKTSVVQFGSAWCVKCHEFFPTFYSLTKKYKSLPYAVAQVDTMEERAKGVKYSPTFVFLKNGKKVDEVLGKDAQKLEDHLWLHNT